uniref:Death domain-containing protein n=1 Tax=Heterorhabditis bacteriophora TaxID=37862 RepID=A0A1I7XHM7_HETBA
MNKSEMCYSSETDSDTSEFELVYNKAVQLASLNNLKNNMSNMKSNLNKERTDAMKASDMKHSGILVGDVSVTRLQQMLHKATIEAVECKARVFELENELTAEREMREKVEIIAKSMSEEVDLMIKVVAATEEEKNDLACEIQNVKAAAQAELRRYRDTWFTKIDEDKEYETSVARLKVDFTCLNHFFSKYAIPIKNISRLSDKKFQNMSPTEINKLHNDVGQLREQINKTIKLTYAISKEVASKSNRLDSLFVGLKERIDKLEDKSAEEKEIDTVVNESNEDKEFSFEFFDNTRLYRCPFKFSVLGRTVFAKDMLCDFTIKEFISLEDVTEKILKHICDKWSQPELIRMMWKNFRMKQFPFVDDFLTKLAEIVMICYSCYEQVNSDVEKMTELRWILRIAFRNSGLRYLKNLKKSFGKYADIILAQPTYNDLMMVLPSIIGGDATGEPSTNDDAALNSNTKKRSEDFNHRCQ